MRISQKISSVQTPPHREYPDIWPTWGRTCPKEEQDFKPSAAPLAYEKTAFRGVQLLHYHWFAFAFAPVLLITQRCHVTVIGQSKVCFKVLVGNTKPLLFINFLLVHDSHIDR